MDTIETIVITVATGQLGRLVIAELQRLAPQARLVGLVRNPAAAQDLALRGVELRTADYEDAARAASITLRCCAARRPTWLDEISRILSTPARAVRSAAASS